MKPLQCSYRGCETKTFEVLCDYHVRRLGLQDYMPKKQLNALELTKEKNRHLRNKVEDVTRKPLNALEMTKRMNWCLRNINSSVTRRK